MVLVLIRVPFLIMDFVPNNHSTYTTQLSHTHNTQQQYYTTTQHKTLPMCTVCITGSPIGPSPNSCFVYFVLHTTILQQKQNHNTKQHN